MSLPVRVGYVSASLPDAEHMRSHFAEHVRDIQVQLITSARECFVRIAAERFQLLLIDQQLPDMGVLAFVGEVQRRSAGMPLIVLTDESHEDAAVAALRLGASDYLVKRRHYLTQLPHVIEHALQRSRLEQTNRRLEAELTCARDTSRTDSGVPNTLCEQPARIGMLIDITARKQAESLLRESEARYRTLFEYAGDGLVIADSESYYLDVNASICRMLGYTRDELIGLHARDIVTLDETSHIEPALVAIQATSDYHREWQFRRKDGSTFAGDVRVTILPDGNLLGVIRDITERRRAEERIRQLNRTYTVLSEINQLIVRDREPSTIIARACSIAVEKGGFLLAWIGLLDPTTAKLRLAAHAAAAPGALEMLEQMFDESGSGDAFSARALATGAHALCDDIEHDPLAAPWRLTALRRGYRAMASFPLIGAGETIGTFNLYAGDMHLLDTDELRLLDELAWDIGFALECSKSESRRQRAESALRQSEALFRTVLETVALVGLMLDRDGRITLCSDHLLAITGWTRQQALGRDWFEMFLPSDDRESAAERFRQSVLTGVPPLHEESEIITRLGERRLIAWSISIVRDHTGGVAGVASLGEDVTARRQREAEIQKLAAFPQLNPNLVLEFAADGTLAYANPAFHLLARRVGVGSAAELLPAETAATVAECLASSRPRLRLETHRGGRSFSWSFYPIIHQRIVHCYATDITERLRLEEHVRQAQKMDAIGNLAGGIAHDFNNLLTVIMGNTALLQADHSDFMCADALDQIAHAGQRASDLTRQLLAFSRRQVLEQRVLELNQVVTGIAGMLQRILRPDVSIGLRLHPRPLLTRADAGMLDQVIMNLALNARDAMPEGGKIEMKTAEVHVTDADLGEFTDARPGPHVLLRVTDTGCGIPQEVMSRIYEPFFTTKELGKGVGLGLAMVFGIIKQHAGILRVQTEVGRGTTFDVLLPAIQNEAAS